VSALAATWHDVGLVVLRTVVVYAFVLVGLRLTGKREAGQMTPFDLALLLLLANAVQNAMVGPDTSLVGGLTAAGVLLLLNATLGRAAARSRRLSGLLRGHARLLVNHGMVQEANLKAEGIDHEDLMQALREHGVAAVEDVRLAVLEVDGAISVLKNDDVVPAAHHKPHHRIRFLNRG
jgi:uncharacterized membrane protein YcaP (DUF421 family)